MLLKELERIISLSGFMLNLTKMEALVLKGPSVPLWTSVIPIQWQTNSIKYLGVHTTKMQNNLYKTNITLSRKLGANIIDMEPASFEFPKVLYLLQLLPIYLEPKEEFITYM